MPRFAPFALLILLSFATLSASAETVGTDPEAPAGAKVQNEEAYRLPGATIYRTGVEVWAGPAAAGATRDCFDAHNDGDCDDTSYRVGTNVAPVGLYARQGPGWMMVCRYAPAGGGCTNLPGLP